MSEHRPEQGEPAEESRGGPPGQPSPHQPLPDKLPPGQPRPDRIYEATAPLERTALSWNRYMLALAVNGALLARVGDKVGAWAIVAGVLILLVALASWLFTSRAYRRGSGRPTPALIGNRGAWLLTIVAVFVGLADLAAIISYP